VTDMGYVTVEMGFSCWW